MEVETINARMKIPTFLDPDNLIQPIDASYHSLIATSLPLPRIPSHDKITGHRLETKRISTHLHALRIGFSRECQGPARPGARTTSREKSRRREKFPPRRISLALFQHRIFQNHRSDLVPESLGIINSNRIINIPYRTTFVNQYVRNNLPRRD